jgi:hypothetical protein
MLIKTIRLIGSNIIYRLIFTRSYIIIKKYWPKAKYIFKADKIEAIYIANANILLIRGLYYKLSNK